MTLIGIKFLDPVEILIIKDIIDHNSEQQVAKTLFNVSVHSIGFDILIIIKEYVAVKVMLLIYAVLCVGAIIPLIFWGVWIPLIIVLSLACFFIFFNSASFNYMMFKIMFRKQGHNQKMVML